MSRPQIHQFRIRACRAAEGSAHKSLILAQRLVGEIKQRQAASLSRDEAADKDLSMAHFHGTEGWKEGGRDEAREKEFKQLENGVKSKGPKFLRVAQKLFCWAKKKHLQLKNVPPP